MTACSSWQCDNKDLTEMYVVTKLNAIAPLTMCKSCAADRVRNYSTYFYTYDEAILYAVKKSI